MKNLKIAIICLAVYCLAIYALLWLSSFGLIRSLKLHGVEPYAFLAIDLAKHGVKFQKLAGGLTSVLAFGIPTAFLAALLHSIITGQRKELHGSAKLATKSDLVKAKLLEPDAPEDKHPSVIVGKLDGSFLLFKGQQFLYLAAPTRSGKGVGIVIPNLLHYRDSVVVLDIKGENFNMTAGFRAKCGQSVHRLSPDDENFETDCWNPMDYVRDDHTFRISDLLSIANILYPPTDDSPWTSTAENLFLGLALYIMDTAKERNNFNIPHIWKLATTLAFLKDEETFDAYVQSREKFEPLSEDAVIRLRQFAQTQERVRNSVLITFNQPLGIFGDPVTAKATSKSTFNLKDVRRKRMSVYVSIKPNNIDKYGKFINLFFQQLINLNMDKLPEEDPSLKYQCLLLLDEFPAMGRVAIIEKASAYMAGYNMRLLLIFQNKSQIKNSKLYGSEGAETLMGNMALQIIYAPRKDDEAKEYSEMVGYMTWKGKSTSGKRQLFGFSTDNETTSDQRRAVLLPQEIKDIGQDAEIISMENMKPALVEKIRWYNEPIFTSRANLPTPHIETQLTLENSIQRLEGFSIDAFRGQQTKQSIAPGASFEVGFSPRRNALEVVMSIILNTKEELLVAAYSLTSEEISHALAEAKGRGVDVRVVVDHEQNSDDQGGYKAVDFLLSKNIPVRRIKNYAAMHHKFMVSDNKHVQLGSFNYTKSANVRNAETAITFMDLPELATVYKAEWVRLNTEPEVSTSDIEAVDKGLDLLEELGIFA